MGYIHIDQFSVTFFINNNFYFSLLVWSIILGQLECNFSINYFFINNVLHLLLGFLCCLLRSGSCRMLMMIGYKHCEYTSLRNHTTTQLWQSICKSQWLIQKLQTFSMSGAALIMLFFCSAASPKVSGCLNILIWIHVLTKTSSTSAKGESVPMLWAVILFLHTKANGFWRYSL